MTIDDPVQIASWLAGVERVGGWAVVVFVVVWLTKGRDRSESRTQEMLGEFKRAVQVFSDFEREERAAHESILESDRAVLDATTKILQTQDRIVETLDRISSRLTDG